MDGEVEGKEARRHRDVVGRGRVHVGERPWRQAPECRRDDGDGLADLAGDLGSGHVLAGELRVAVSHVAGFAEYRAHEVLKVPAKVEGEIAGGVRDARQRTPHRRVVRKERDFPAQRLQVPDQDAAQAAQGIGHEIKLPRRRTGRYRRRSRLAPRGTDQLSSGGTLPGSLATTITGGRAYVSYVQVGAAGRHPVVPRWERGV